MSSLTFGKYRLVAELGQGGMADVILALSHGPVGFSKLVVIKRLREHLAGDPEFVGMLIDEARLAARLNHPNIVHTNEVGEIDGNFFIAMEYLEGQPFTRLRRRAKKKGDPLSVDTQLQIISDVLGGLDYAHELTDYDGTPLGVVHRDVTPSNIFITYDGITKLVDFGIAKATGRSTETKTGVVKGKMTYMPPEQALGQVVDRRADVFSVGVMLWEAVTGLRMWKDVEDVVVLGKLINGDLPLSPQEQNPDVPDELDAICQKALAPDPDDRYETAAEFQAVIDKYLEERNARVPNREIGQKVSTLFESDRKGIRQIIESQLSKMTDEAALTLEPVLIPDSLPHSQRSASMTIPGQTNGTSTDISPGGTASGADAVPVPARRGSVLMLGVALAAVVLGIVWIVKNPPAESVAGPAAALPSADAPASPSPSAATSASASNEIRVTLRAVPASAQFSIDKGPWLDNPHVRRVALDPGEHQVRVRARGHKMKTIVTPFDQDVVLDVTLIPSTKRAARPAAPRPDNDDLPTPPQVTPRDLDDGSPWDE